MNDNISRERQFAGSLERVCRTAREQGNCISREQVEEAFASMNLNETQFGMVFDYLEKHNIGLGHPPDPDTVLTREEKDYLQYYLDVLEEYPSYSQEELEGIFASAMAGDSLSRQKLTEGCLKNVADVARLYVGQGVSLEDLIGEGNMALTMGIEMLGSMKGSGAVRNAGEVPGVLTGLVMDAMERHIRENAANVKADRKTADRVNQVADRARELAEQLGRKVTPEELAMETGMPVESIWDAMRISGFQIEDIG